MEGRDVNLTSLLIPYYSGPSCVGEKLGDKPDPRLNKQLNLSEFILAFGVYKNIMCEAFPQRRSELDLYERDVVDMGSRYAGSGFFDYHKQFSAKAAAHLKFHNLKVDWSVRNNTLFCNIFANNKPNSCEHCASCDHSSGFCPSLLQDSTSNTSNPHSTQSPNPSYRGRNDMYGRAINSHQGNEICNNYNGERGCWRQRCNNLHVCAVCKQNHPKTQCRAAKNYQRPYKPVTR